MKKILIFNLLLVSFLVCNKGKNENIVFPSDVIYSLDKWKILLGDGTYKESLINYKKDHFFYVSSDSKGNWVVFKTPNAGVTSRTSKNTRTELHQKKYWTPEIGGKLSGTLKIQHISTTGDATVPSSFSVVIGQIHSDEGHENEPLKIYYKKFPGHKKGSVFWNYEINTKGDNKGRFDFSTVVWGYDWSVVGPNSTTNPKEPKDGIELGEEFTYEVNVFKGIMHLTFTSKNHKKVTFSKNLLLSDFASKKDIPQQVINLYSLKRTVSEEKENAYSGELMYFKQGAYNQANGQSTKSKIFDGDILKQYKNGSYAEVWFKESTLGAGALVDENPIYASHVIPFFDHWNLILGDGSNAGIANNFENKDFFFTTNDGTTDWVVFKTPNAGDTHGTSNNTRTELAQLKKWYPKTAKDKLTATLKVMNVSSTGDARVAASHSVVVGQIHSADKHENEPLKIFYKKFPGHTKGSVFWHYEINTKGDDNAGRWDFSTSVWGYDFSVVGSEENSYPEEPKEGITLGEEFSYEIEVKNGVMNLKFRSKNHKTKIFTKNLINSEYTTTEDIPLQTQRLFVPIGQDGVELADAYLGEGLFFKLGAYNQTNGKSPEINKNWCSGAETHGGNLKKQYEDGNYAEVWFKKGSIIINDNAISNKDYFMKND